MYIQKASKYVKKKESCDFVLCVARGGIGYYYDDDSHHLCVYLIQHSTASATIIIITRKCFLFSFHIRISGENNKIYQGIIIINTTFAMCVQTRYIEGKKKTAYIRKPFAGLLVLCIDGSI